ncbi:MAG: IS4 family transposase [Candidatus Tenebribacter mawsonii]|nr:IS4 family transposase [Candidatus Tenebribacter mawsonii]
MNEGKTVFSQIMSFFPKYEFDKKVIKYKGNYKVRNFNCWDQFLCMGFAQLTYRSSLRDIEACLNAQPYKLYHMGIRGNISRTNLANANQTRDWKIYAEFAQYLISTARNLYQNDKLEELDLDGVIYALDSTTIDLCLSLFPWAKFRKRKGAIKLHTLLDIRGSIPTFIEITDGLVHDVNILDVLVPEPGSYYIMDRAYIDYKRLYRLNKGLGYFIIRAKKNLKFKRLYSNKVDKSKGLRCDQTVKLMGYYQKKDYSETIRRVKFYDEENKKTFVFLTNNFEISAMTVALLYKNRWKIELFFKWIKQHLKIKSFYGTSANAVKTQIWVSICVYIMIAIIKKTMKIEMSLYKILQILSVSVFEKVPILQLLTEYNYRTERHSDPNQLILFDL